MVKMYPSLQITLCLIFLHLHGGAFADEIDQNQEDFSGHQVWRILPDTKHQVKYLRLLQEQYIDVLDFWTSPSFTQHNVDVHVPKQLLSRMKKLLDERQLQYSIIVDNLQSVISQQRKDQVKSRKKRDADSEASNFKQFNEYILNSFASHDNINLWLENISSLYWSMCETYDIGTTGEGRTIKIIKISSNKAKEGNTSKKAIWIEAGMHGREWISPVTANNIIYNLITEYERDMCVRRIVDDFDWYILPVANPDGYEYSHSRNRMWRKNRRVSEVPKRPWWSVYYNQSYQGFSYRHCYGVDLNRNFGFKWGVSGTSRNPCSDIYQGPEAFSEPETAAIRDFTSKIHNNTNILVYLSLHAYGQLLVYSWGYTRQRPKDHRALKYIASQSAEAIYLGSNRKTYYTVGSAARILYASSGCSDDWAKGSLGAKYAFTLELPPSDAASNHMNGFLLPDTAIPEIRNSTWIGVKAMAELSLSSEDGSANGYYGYRESFCTQTPESMNQPEAENFPMFEEL